jgi:glycosyltransferase involved in cell wall biosynthesis
MIYVCIPSYNEAETVGLVLWKIRKVFEEFPREYQILVADDGSSDRTPELLEPYTRVLPLTVIRSETRRGYARSVEALLARGLELTDRPKRDSAVLMHADFTHGPQYLPDFLRRLESGADLVVGEAGTVLGEPSASRRLARRWASRLLRRGLRVPGVSDLVSGFLAVRLVVLRQVFKGGNRPLMGEGWAANAELVARTAGYARRVESVRIEERHDLRARESRLLPWTALREAWKAGGRIRLPGAPA